MTHAPYVTNNFGPQGFYQEHIVEGVVVGAEDFRFACQAWEELQAEKREKQSPRLWERCKIAWKFVIGK